MTTTPVEPTIGPRRVLASDLIGGIVPRGVSLGGAVLGVILVVRSLTGRREEVAEHHQEEASDDLEYVFHTANLRQWVETLGWFMGFFVSLYCLGLYATAVIFTVLYLRTQDGRSWLFSAIYAAILTGVLYLAFAVALAQRVPAGFFGLG
jgi:hypothetical protein